jgi:hypothetical protein
MAGRAPGDDSDDRGSDEQTLARNMIEVHGMRAAAVARENARSAAVAGQGTRARYWIQVLDLIQRAGRASTPEPVSDPPADRTK